MKQLILIDGHALFHRAFHGMPPLTTSRGELVNAVYGFTAMVLRVISDVSPEYIAVTFDTSAPTFRHQDYTAYKANRPAAPEGLHEQLPRVKEIVAALNIPIFEVPGYEADDLIGTLARQATEGVKDLEVYIVTGDRDAIQLVTDQVKVYTPGKSLSDIILYDIPKVKEKYGFEPRQLIDYKALAGDSSDNIPGVRGIGVVSATKLVQEFGSVEDIYKNLDKVPDRQRKLLSEDSESAVMSKKLATIDTQVPIKLDLKKCTVRDYDKEKVTTLFQELEFKSLLTRLPKSDQVGFGLFGDQKNVIASDSEAISTVEIATPSSDTQARKDTENPLQRILTEMTKNGVLIDPKVLKNQAGNLNTQLTKIEQEIYHAVGHEFNLNSPSQLSNVLYNELGLTPGRKKKTHFSTDQETLTSLVGAHPAIEMLLQYRELFKLKSTYLDALPTLIKEDGRIHTSWHAEGTRTGRISSSDPNLQNIPVKGEWGSKIRQFFIAPKDHVLLAADYNQIELRVMAHMSSDPALTDIFKKGQDIHAATASWIFSKKPEEITKDERRLAKTVNFGVLYGQSAYGLAQQLKIDPKVASEFINRYYTRFAKVKEYQDKILKEAKEKGYLETLSGFRRYLLELQSPNYAIRQAGERMAINMPIQGTAADIIKAAMVKLDKIFKDTKLGTKMVLQVHDELVFEVPEKELKEVAPIVKKEMEEALPLSVPVIVELKIGQNWGETKTLDLG